jgi:hypothetical protein
MVVIANEFILIRVVSNELKSQYELLKINIFLHLKALYFYHNFHFKDFEYIIFRCDCLQYHLLEKARSKMEEGQKAQ